MRRAESLQLRRQSAVRVPGACEWAPGQEAAG